MRRTISFLAMSVCLLAITLAMAGSQNMVRAQLDLNNEDSFAYLPFVSKPVLPVVSLSNITFSPPSPVTLPSDQNQHIDVSVKVSTNYRGALVASLYRKTTLRDSHCVMVNPPGPTTANLDLDVVLNGQPGTKDFTIEIRFKPAAGSCSSASPFSDVVKTKPYQITWENDTDNCNTPPFTQLLRNGSFEEGWTNYNGSIQLANFWNVSWVPPGQPVYDETGIISNAEPEFTHKLDWQLPAHEQPCQPEALILDGKTTYKIFRGGVWGGELRQTVSGLTPSQRVKLTVPIWQDSVIDAGYEAAAIVSIDGASTGWVWNFQVPQRKWTYHSLETTVPGSGQLTVLIRLKSHFNGADFFIDGIRLEPLP